METFHFSVNGAWQGNRNGTGRIRSKGGLDIGASVPAEFEGPGVGTNPEELLISSANNCFMITLSSLLSNRKIIVEKLEVISEGKVDREEGKLNFRSIIHRPEITIAENPDISEEAIKELAIRAEKACFISKTLRNSIEFSVEPIVLFL